MRNKREPYCVGIETGCRYGKQCGAGGKETPANGGNIRHAGSIPRSGRSLQKEMSTPLSILAWKIPWREEPRELQSMGSQRV